MFVDASYFIVIYVPTLYLCFGGFYDVFALRIHVSFFAEIQVWGTSSAASLHEQILHEFV